MLSVHNNVRYTCGRPNTNTAGTNITINSTSAVTLHPPQHNLGASDNDDIAPVNLLLHKNRVKPFHCS